MDSKNWQEILGWGSSEMNDLRYVAYAYIRQGIYDTALHFFEALAILSPSNVYDLQTVGALHLQMGNALKALEVLDRALELDPFHLKTQLNRAKALFMLGYRRQGLSQSFELEKCKDAEIAAQASALVLAHS